MTTDPSSQIADVIRKAVCEPVRFEVGGIDQEPSFHPPTDLKNTPLEYVAYIDLPGIDEDEIRFVWKPELLVVAGTREFDHDIEDAEEFIQLQRLYGSFSCRIPLDNTVDVDRASAKYRRGVLTIRMPKRKSAAQVL